MKLLKTNLLKSKNKYSCLSKLKDNLLPIYSSIVYNIKKDRESLVVKIETNLDINENNVDNIVQANDKLKKVFSRWESNFFPKEYYVDLIKNYNNIQTFIYSYGTNKITLNVYFKNNNFINDLQYKICKCFTVLEYLNIKDNNIQINYVPLEYKKMIKIGEEFNPINVNSGLTTHGYDTKEIFIFRVEDSDKVFIHELIHYLKKDFAFCNNLKLENKIVQNTKINDHANIFESYTDAYAITFNTTLDSIITKSNLDDMFYTELMYLNQLVKYILDVEDIGSIDVLLKAKNDGTNKIFIQHTNVFAYYILKYGLLSNIEEFIRDYDINNTVWTDTKQVEMYNFGIASLARYKLYTDTVLINKPYIRMTYNELIK